MSCKNPQTASEKNCRSRRNNRDMALRSDESALSEWLKTDRLTTRKRLKRYSLLSTAIGVGIVIVSADMPAHFLWRWLGIPLTVLFVCTFTPVLFYGGRALWDWLDKGEN